MTMLLLVLLLLGSQAARRRTDNRVLAVLEDLRGDTSPTAVQPAATETSDGVQENPLTIPTALKMDQRPRKKHTCSTGNRVFDHDAVFDSWLKANYPIPYRCSPKEARKLMCWQVAPSRDVQSFV